MARAAARTFHINHQATSLKDQRGFTQAPSDGAYGFTQPHFLRLAFFLKKEKYLSDIFKFKNKFKKSGAGFTLIELLVVVSILGLMASILMVSLNSARVRAREAYRRASLRQVATALESFYDDHGYYPTVPDISGESLGYGDHCYWDGCGGNGPYIPGLAPKYLARLPTDPLKDTLPGPDNCGVNYTGYSVAGFKYFSDGVDYMFVDYCTIELPVPTTDTYYDPTRRYWGLTVSTPGAIQRHPNW